MILVTGSSGYLGKHVVAVLDARGIAAITTSRKDSIDLTKEPDVERLLDGLPTLDAIIHCAAIVPKHASEYEDKRGAWESLTMMRHLASRLNRPPIVFASSMTAKDATSAYGWGKRTAEELLQQWQTPGDVIIRLPGLFGLPRRDGLVYNSIRAALADQPFTFNPCRGWTAVTVRDAATTLVDAAMIPPTVPSPMQLFYDAATFQQRVLAFAEEIRAEVNA
jgi:nucleoside-diphosphate-sugar epimerase